MSESPEKAIRVVVIDDHYMLRLGVRLMIEGLPGFEVVGEASDGTGALDVVRKAEADLCVTDMHLPGGGPDLVAQLLDAAPGTKVVVLTVDTTRATVIRCLLAGASGYIPKDSNPAAFESALTAVMNGWTILSHPADFRDLLAVPTPTVRTAGQPDVGDLTARESEILKLVAEGLSNGEIGRRLSISAQTVKNALHIIMGKLRVPNRIAAVMMARDEGFI
jgi:DNA-binding NarL/FixJ family response regulator